MAVYYYDLSQSPLNLVKVTAYRQFELTTSLQYLTDETNANFSFGSHIPPFQQVYSFLLFLYRHGRPASYTAVTCLALMQRMIKEKGLVLHSGNWQQFFLATLNVAHKVRNGGVHLENIIPLWLKSGVNDKQSSVFDRQTLSNLNFNAEVRAADHNSVLERLNIIEQEEHHVIVYK